MRLTPAWHTSTTPKGTVSTPAGLVVEIGGKRIYFSGDTALFSDLALPAKRGHIDVAVIPIGGHYTMDRFDAVVAAELIRADQVIPCHYNTFPPIETDVQAFKADVQNAGFAEVIVLDPGAVAQAMTHAVVLIEAERDELSTLGGALAGSTGWPRPTPSPASGTSWRSCASSATSSSPRSSPGRSSSCPASAARRRWSPSRCSREHDLEAMFSIGQ